MTDIPSHVLSRILELAINSRGPQTASDFLVVNRAFYLAAIPTLYRSPRVADIGSFFFHSNRPYPPDIDVIDNAELVQAGHTKLAALRHVRTLFIDLPEIYESEGDEDLQMTKEQKSQVEQDLRESLIRQMDMAEEYLTRIPTGVLRSLKKVRSGDTTFAMNTPGIRGGDRSWVVGSQHITNLTQQLLQRSTPKIWCETPRSAVYLSLRFPSEAVMATIGADFITVIHVQLCHDINLLRNATNYIYVHPWNCPVHGYRSGGCPRLDQCDDLTLLQITHWLETSIRLVFPRDAKPTSGPVNKGRIIIGGLVESTVKSTKGIRGGEPEAQNEYAEWLRPMEKTLKEDFEGVVDIEMRRAKDMPPCPGCGVTCG